MHQHIQPTSHLVRRRRSIDAPGDGLPRSPVGTSDSATTELVRLITFVWVAGNSIQPVLFVDRQLLN